MGLFADEPVHVVAVDKNERPAAENAEAAAGYLQRQGYRAVPNPIVSTKPVSEILLSHVESIGARIIVMGAHTAVKECSDDYSWAQRRFKSSERPCACLRARG